MLLHPLCAQMSCDAIESFLSKSEAKVKKLNLEDPELIPLHYLFALDLEKELNDFSQNTIPLISNCKELDYYAIVTRFDDIIFRLSLKKMKLETLSKQVDSLFLEKAIREIHYESPENASFYVDKSLQYNPIHPDALILKIRLLFEEEAYEECLEFLHTLYYEAPLRREHEIAISNFNMKYYNRLYTMADSLIKVENATMALELFQTLETFCTNMPTEYCNDDYYHGILRSKKGVYDSYLTIAKVAHERGYMEIEEKFLEYAEEYREVNRTDFPIYESVELPKTDPETATLKEKNEIVDTSKEEESKTTRQEHVVNNEKVTIANQDQEIIEEKIQKEPLFEEEVDALTRKYNRILLEALTLASNGNFMKAYELLKEAVELEKCDCFPKDGRVQLLYDALHKAYSK